MIRLNRWTQNPSGQVLLATLLFCFVFVALFIGLYKSGLIYNAKTRAIQASNLTALSAGAVYCNGMQLVRLTNALVFAAAALDLAALALEMDLTGGLALAIPPKYKDPNTRGLVLSAQDWLFGVTKPTGLYPILMMTETLSIAEQNGLKNNWPALDPSTWAIPLPPTPILIYNLAGIGPNMAQSLIPNMALKFFDASQFLSTLPNKKRKFQFKRKSDNEVFTYTEDQVEKIPNASRTGAQYRVKKGVDENANTFVSEISGVDTTKLNHLIDIINFLISTKLGVTDRDFPAIHNLYLYGSYPTTTKDNNGNIVDIQTLSQINVIGTGLAAWNLGGSPYKTMLASTDPVELAKQVSINSLVNGLIQSGKLPSIKDILPKVSIGPI